jgi:predicted nucleic acid-binding Zn ribbon protein
MGEPQPLNKLILKFLESIGIREKVDENLALVYWHEVVGKEISEKTEPIKVVKGLLFVRVNDTVWRNELQFFKNEILQKLNTKIGKKRISDIKFY